MCLVMLAYSLLMTQLKQSHAKDWAIEQVAEKSRSYDHPVAKLGLI